MPDAQDRTFSCWATTPYHKGTVDCNDTLSHFFGKTSRILRFSVIPFFAWKRASVTHLRRTTRGPCQLFVEIRDRKVDPASLKDGFSLDSPAGRLQARIVASVAEFETEVRAERVAAGQAAARRKGKKWGGSKQGWRWRVTDEQQVSAIHDVRGRGKKIAHIARVTDLPRPATIALT